MKNTFFALALASVVLWSCDKDDKPEEDTKTDLLVKQTWTFEKAGGDVDKNGTIDLDVTGQVQPCLKDNTITFSTNGSGVVNEGATKCNTTDPATTNFNRSFANNENSLNITGNAIAGTSGQFKIVELTDTRLSLSKDTVYLGTAAAFIVSLKH